MFNFFNFSSVGNSSMWNDFASWKIIRDTSFGIFAWGLVEGCITDEILKIAGSL